MRRILRLTLPALALAALSAAAPRAAQAQQRIRCESHGYDRTYCNADTRGGVSVVRQLSSTSCERGRTWGTARQGIWVSNGCRADFAVSYPGNGNANANVNGRWNNGRGNGNGRWNRVSSRNGVSSSDAAARCRSAVQDRIDRSRNADVRITGGGWDGNVDSYLLNFETNRGDYGQCQVMSNGRVIISHTRR
jgi:hypothetical protein